MSTDVVAGDSGTLLRVSLSNKQTRQPVDLSGATVNLKYRIDGGPLETRAMTIVAPATSGIAEYRFASSDLVLGAGVSHGLLRYEIEVTDAGGKITTSLDIVSLTIRAKV